ncbi:MAG: hypothetical protein ACKVG0_02440, partial [Alphaproteobacteria bacterium]
TAVRAELGRYKTTSDYQRFRHKERSMANASFALGMVASIADKLTAMKAGRDEANSSTGRDLVVLKTAVVDAELEKLDLNLRKQRSARRMVSTTAYEAGGTAFYVQPHLVSQTRFKYLRTEAFGAWASATKAA